MQTVRMPWRQHRRQQKMGGMTAVIGPNVRPLYSADMTINSISVLLLAAVVASLPACSSKPAATTTSLTPPFLETPIAPRPAVSIASVEKGKHLYQTNCVQCHGPEGKGDGYGA